MKTTYKLLLIGAVTIGVIAGISVFGHNSTVDNVSHNQNDHSQISLDEAKNIALKRYEGNIQDIQLDDQFYEIELVKGDYFYEVKIDKDSGKIVKEEQERLKPAKYSIEQAKDMALKEVKGKVIKAKTDAEEYHIYIEKDKKIYEVEVDRVTGVIDHIELEYEETNNGIGLDQAKKIALNKVGGGTIISVDDDHDSYEIEIEYKGYLYEVEIHKSNGKIIDFDKKKKRSY